MKKLNLHHLYLFYYIAKYKSITKAANFLEISQPAVSLQIKNFQKECGVQLLDIVDKKI
ncbi:MAG: LysR family transcriptional regulator, partial [Spirochaetia bacterium]|nr:LysR family transcriptional regulator [Spirochaetia bacterium]